MAARKKKTTAPKAETKKKTTKRVNKATPSQVKKKTKSPRTMKKRPVLSLEDRENMIRDTAYFRAEQNQFMGDPQEFWCEAEKEIDSKFGFETTTVRQ